MSLFGRRRAKRGGSGYDYWVTATELMSAVMLVFILLALIAMLRAKDEERALAAFQKDCESLRESIEVLQSCEKARDAAVAARDASQAALRQCEADRDARVSTEQACVRWLNDRDKVNRAVEDFLKKTKFNSEVTAGVVRIPAEVLFETGSAVLSRDGKRTLRDLIPLYATAIMQASVRDAVKRVLIVGRSSKVGDDFVNMRLSVARAIAVYEFLVRGLPQNVRPVPEFLRLLTPAGRGELDATAGEGIDDPRDRTVDLQIEFNLPDPVSVAPRDLPRSGSGQQ